MAAADGAAIPSLAAGGDGEGQVAELLAGLKEAFLFATKTGIQITALKTVEGAKKTVSEQRPNIG